MNDFIEEILVSEVVEEAGKEKEMEDVLMNSLFIEDSLLDNYTQDALLDNIILQTNPNYFKFLSSKKSESIIN